MDKVWWFIIVIVVLVLLYLLYQHNNSEAFNSQDMMNQPYTMGGIGVGSLCCCCLLIFLIFIIYRLAKNDKSGNKDPLYIDTFTNKIKGFQSKIKNKTTLEGIEYCRNFLKKYDIQYL